MWQRFRYNILKVAKRTPSESNGPSHIHMMCPTHTHTFMHTHKGTRTRTRTLCAPWGPKFCSLSRKLEILIACNLKMK